MTDEIKPENTEIPSVLQMLVAGTAWETHDNSSPKFMIITMNADGSFRVSVQMPYEDMVEATLLMFRLLPAEIKPELVRHMAFDLAKTSTNKEDLN